MVFLSVAIYGNLTIQGKYFLNDLSCWVELRKKSCGAFIFLHLDIINAEIDNVVS